jgi:hypothetical protein
MDAHKIKSLTNLKLELFSELELLDPYYEWNRVMELINKMGKIQRLIKKLSTPS